MQLIQEPATRRSLNTMLSVMIIIETKSEKDAFAKAMESLKLHCIMTEPNYSNYVKTLQYMPDIILMEIPAKSARHFHFIQMLKQHHHARTIPLICFGNAIEEPIKKGMEKVGIDRYFQRPFDIGSFAEIIKQTIRQKEKSNFQKPIVRQTLNQKEIEALLSPKTSPVAKTKIMTQYVSGLMAFPFTVSKIIQLSNSESTGATDLAKVIESDPVISANILKICNSVLFAASNRRIGSIKDAVIRIGFNETRRIAMSMSVMKLFDSGKGNYGFDRVNFWLHCLATAIVAEHIAKKMGDVNSDEAFLVGLLHDFGIIILDEFFFPLFNKLLELTTNTASRFYAVEKEVIGITHIAVTDELFKEWKMPETIREAILNHYSILDHENPLDSPASKLSFCASIGNTIAKIFSFGAACDLYVVPLQNWVFQKAKIPFGFRQKYTESITKDLMLYQEFLKIKDDHKSISKVARKIQDAYCIGILNCTDAIFLPAEIYCADQGHTVIHLKPGKEKVDAALTPGLFFIYTSDATTAAEVHEAMNSILKEFGTDPKKGDPSILRFCAFVDRQSALLDSVECARISMIYKDFDLRQFDDDIVSIMSGEIIRPRVVTTKEPKKLIKAEGIPQNQNVLASLLNTSMNENVLRIQKECREKGIKTLEYNNAETLFITAQLKMNTGNHVDAHWMMQLAELYFQKARLSFECSGNSKKIDDFEKALSVEERMVLDRLLKK
jgi:HD-like signal output (HDOD) protein/DNA-binding NarL/FixJ family response regulator